MRSTLLGVFSVVLAPAIAVAQVQIPYQPATAQAPQAQPTPPPQQPYPYYPPPQQPYPYYPPPPQQQVQRPVAPPPAPPPARLTLATRSMEVAQLVTACANSIDNYHLDVARKKCGEALAKEDSLAFAHYLVAQADAPDVAQKE